MDSKKLKVGSIVRWRAERMFKSWDTYGVVKLIKGDDVTILTFDDFKQTTVSLHGEAIRDEMSLVNQTDLETYLESRVTKIKHKISEAEQTKAELKRQLKEIADYKAQMYNVV